VLTGIGFGLVLALQSADVQFFHGQPADGAESRRMADVLVVAEASLSMVLLVGA